MKTILSLFTMLSFSGVLLAQSPISKVYYNDNLGGINSNSLATGHNNSYVICGSTSSTNGYIQGIASDGSILWNKTLETNVNVFPRVDLKHVISSPDDSYIFSGYMYNETSTAHDAFITKTDAQGDTLWTNALTLSGENWLVAQKSHINPDNTINVLLTSLEGPNVAIAIISADGDLLSSMKFQFPDDIFAESFIKLSDDSYVIVGRNVANNGWLLHAASDGTILSSSSYNSFILKDVTVLNTNENVLYLMAQSLSDGKITCLKTDLNGVVEWTHTDPVMCNSTVINAEQFKILPYVDNKIVLLYGTDHDAYLCVMDTNGVTESNLRPLVKAMDMTLAADGSLAILGNGPILGVRSDLFSPTIGFISTDTLLTNPTCLDDWFDNWETTTLSSLNLIVSTSSATLDQHHLPFELVSVATQLVDGCVNTIGGIDENASVRLLAFPTITNGEITLSSEEINPVELVVLDERGKTVANYLIRKGEMQLDLSFLSKGAYFCHFLTEDMRTSTQKIILIND